MTKPKPRSVWCPLTLADGTVCGTERVTASHPRCKLKCTGCGGYYRTPDNPALHDGMPVASTTGPPAEPDEAPAPAPPPDPPPPPPDPAGDEGRARRAKESGARGGRAAARLARSRG